MHPAHALQVPLPWSFLHRGGMGMLLAQRQGWQSLGAQEEKEQVREALEG